MEDLRIGPLLACAIGDAYASGFEFADKQFVNKNNSLEYVQNPKHRTLRPGHYTDDTQMALGVVEHLLDRTIFTPMSLATRWVTGFHRDPRKGYAAGFYDFLLKTKTGEEFLANIHPHSTKNGGAMRAFPCGFLRDVNQVRDFAMMQASLTHATYPGMLAAAAAALAFHYTYHRKGSKLDLPIWLSDKVGYDFTSMWAAPVGTQAMACVHAAIEAYMQGDSLMDVLHKCVAWTGDVDTVAAIAMPIAAVCPETKLNINPALVDGLEDETYGRTYLEELDARLRREFPPLKWQRRRGAVTPTKATTPVDDNPLAFLFDDDI